MRGGGRGVRGGGRGGGGRGGGRGGGGRARGAPQVNADAVASLQRGFNKQLSSTKHASSSSGGVARASSVSAVSRTAAATGVSGDDDDFTAQLRRRHASHDDDDDDDDGVVSISASKRVKQQQQQHAGDVKATHKHSSSAHSDAHAHATKHKASSSSSSSRAAASADDDASRASTATGDASSSSSSSSPAARALLSASEQSELLVALVQRECGGVRLSVPAGAFLTAKPDGESGGKVSDDSLVSLLCDTLGGRGIGASAPRAAECRPRALIVCGNALRACDLLRRIVSTGRVTRTQRIAKLFAKHMKQDEQETLLRAGGIAIGIGTPARLLALAKSGALQFDDMRIVLIDNAPDTKQLTAITHQQVRHDLAEFYHQCVVERQVSDGSRLRVAVV